MTPRARSSGVQLQQFVERAAFLVGGGELEVLELQPHFGADDLGEGAADQHRGADDRALDALGGGADVVDCRGLQHLAGGVAVHLGPDNAMPRPCTRPLLALAAALLASSAAADTLIDNVNGIQVGPDGQLQHFTGLLISDDGKVDPRRSGRLTTRARRRNVRRRRRTHFASRTDRRAWPCDRAWPRCASARPHWDDVGRRPAATAARLCGGASRSAVDPGSRMESGTVDRETLPHRGRSRLCRARTGRSCWNASTATRSSPTARQ